MGQLRQVITVQRALPWPPNKLPHLTTTCKYVDSTTHAHVFNLQLCELFKEAWLPIKFAHPDWRISFKKTLLGGPGKARRTVKDKLQKCQTRAARVLCDIRSADLIEAYPVIPRRLRAKSTLMYKIVNDDPAPNLTNSFARRNTSQTNYHLRNSATDLTVPKPKREFLKRSFKYSGAMIWNQLPTCKLSCRIH